MKGSSVPLILRAVEKGDAKSSRHTLVGRAYVHGFIDGEMMSALGKPGTGNKTFEAIQLV